jgi:hypothetical protein
MAYKSALDIAYFQFVARADHLPEMAAKDYADVEERWMRRQA